MDESVKRLLRGYAQMNYYSRKEIRDFIKDYEDKEFKEKRSIEEQLNKSLGPTSDMNCPCCGR